MSFLIKVFWLVWLFVKVQNSEPQAKYKNFSFPMVFSFQKFRKISHFPYLFRGNKSIEYQQVQFEQCTNLLISEN